MVRLTYTSTHAPSHMHQHICTSTYAHTHMYTQISHTQTVTLVLRGLVLTAHALRYHGYSGPLPLPPPALKVLLTVSVLGKPRPFTFSWSHDCCLSSVTGVLLETSVSEVQKTTSLSCHVNVQSSLPEVSSSLLTFSPHVSIARSHSPSPSLRSVSFFAVSLAHIPPPSLSQGGKLNTTYLWNFNDSTSPVNVTGFQLGASQNHTFSIPGQFMVSVLASNNGGSSKAVTQITLNGM